MAHQTQTPPTAKSDDQAEAKQADRAEKTAETHEAEQAARSDAELIRSAAEREAVEIRKAAEQEADRIKKEAEAEARRTRKATEAEARRTELANQAREAEARAVEEAARVEAERIKPAADRLPAMVTFAQQQLEVTAQLTRAIWERNLALAAGMAPAYLGAWELAFAGLNPFNGPADRALRTAEAGAGVAAELLNV